MPRKSLDIGFLFVILEIFFKQTGCVHSLCTYPLFCPVFFNRAFFLNNGSRIPKKAPIVQNIAGWQYRFTKVIIYDYFRLDIT